jgi:DNA-binding NarL/FixJ family response regulator
MQKKPSTKSTATRRHKVLVVDDHPMTRDGVTHLINKQPEMEVCANAGNPAGAFEAIGKLYPDLVLTDMTMPGRSGLEFIKDLLAAHPTLVILVLSMHDEAVYAERVLRAGARGYIMKEAGGEKLLTAIRRVLGGQVYLSDPMSAKILDNLSGQKPRGSHSPIQKLSDREFEIFQLIGQGKSTCDIATGLHISPKTVDVHRSHIKEKLDLTDATSLIRHAVRWVESQEAKA